MRGSEQVLVLETVVKQLVQVSKECGFHESVSRAAQKMQERVRDLETELEDERNRSQALLAGVRESQEQWEKMREQRDAANATRELMKAAEQKLTKVVDAAKVVAGAFSGTSITTIQDLQSALAELDR